MIKKKRVKLMYNEGLSISVILYGWMNNTKFQFSEKVKN